MSNSLQPPSFHVAVVNLPGDGAPLGAVEQLLIDAIEHDNLVWAGVFGHDDFRRVPRAWIDDLRHQETRRHRLLVALSGPPFSGQTECGLPAIQPDDDLTDVEVWGTVSVSNPLLDNTHLLDGLELAVHPERRRIGIGTALLEAAEQVAREWGATTILGWGTHSSGAGRPDALRPREGDYSIAPDAATQLAMTHGYRLAQCERHSTQTVPTEPVAVPECPDGYELVRWQNHTPEQFLEQKCRLNEAMSSDVPKGELELEDENWTVERLVTGQQAAYEHHQGLTVAARHLATGELAGFTELRRHPDLPTVGWQEVTVVTKSHRGHGLGRVLKWANVEHCQQQWPQIERIHTWNAGENQWMLAINDELGYQTATVGAAWQKKLNG